MELATNLSIFSSLSPVDSSIYVKGEACFMFDVNFNSTRFLYVTHILTSIINSLLSVTAIAGNAAVIFTVWKNPSLQSPSNVFICCLAGSDLMVGLLAQPCFILHKIGEIFHRLEMYCVTRMLLEFVAHITTGGSVFTMAAAGLDTWLALYLHLRYNEIVTVRRVLFVIACFWIFLIALAVLRVFLIRPNVYNTILITLLSLCLLSTYFACVKVLKCVRQHERRIHATGVSLGQTEGKGGRLMSLLQCKKSTISMFLIVGIFTVCFLPLLCVSFVHQISGYTVNVKIAYAFVSTLAFMNSSVNPLVYCWRMKTLRNAVKTTVKDRLCKRLLKNSSSRKKPEPLY
ncbi:adenosine receptor A3-like [Montipora capricornis]|uniref:adenosine receptor A3-like n=1 Tax=Montipora capricornis TaxID=246305 RepID=UPI0035F1ECF2